METSDLLRLILILVGVLLLFMTILSLARRKMTETFCLAWGAFSVLLMLAGIFLRPTEVVHYVSPMGLVLILLAGFCVIAAAYFISTQISVLTRKNQELAMQVSLLNQENEQILKKLKMNRKPEEEETDNEKEDIVCH